MLEHTDRRDIDLISLCAMPAIEPNPAPGDSGADEQKALDVGGGLHQLALRYWSEGRAQDAVRVDLEAGKILEPAAPGSALMADVSSTLAALVTELRSEGAEQSLLGEAEEFISGRPSGPTEPGPGETQS